MRKIKTILALLFAMTATTLGDIFMAKLLRPYEGVAISNLSQVWDIVLNLLCCGTFWLAIVCFLSFFITWLSVLSYEDLSFALPLTAITYILNAFLAGPMLGEQLSPTRWLGTIIIGLGVVFVSLSEGQKAQPNCNSESKAPPPQAHQA
ncbi:MAG: EamA family transporter [Candidatus Bruticola sp.]